MKSPAELIGIGQMANHRASALFKSKQTERAPRLAVITGSDAVRSIVWDHHEPVYNPGTNDFWRFLDLLRDRGEIKWSRVHLVPNYLRSKGRKFDLRNYDLFCKDFR